MTTPSQQMSASESSVSDASGIPKRLRPNAPEPTRQSALPLGGGQPLPHSLELKALSFCDMRTLALFADTSHSCRDLVVRWFGQPHTIDLTPQLDSLDSEAAGGPSEPAGDEAWRRFVHLAAEHSRAATRIQFTEPGRPRPSLTLAQVRILQRHLPKLVRNNAHALHCLDIAPPFASCATLDVANALASCTQLKVVNTNPFEDTLSAQDVDKLLFDVVRRSSSTLRELYTSARMARPSCAPSPSQHGLHASLAKILDRAPRLVKLDICLDVVPWSTNNLNTTLTAWIRNIAKNWKECCESVFAALSRQTALENLILRPKIYNEEVNDRSMEPGKLLHHALQCMPNLTALTVYASHLLSSRNDPVVVTLPTVQVLRILCNTSIPMDDGSPDSLDDLPTVRAQQLKTLSMFGDAVLFAHILGNLGAEKTLKEVYMVFDDSESTIPKHALDRLVECRFAALVTWETGEIECPEALVDQLILYSPNLETLCCQLSGPIRVDLVRRMLHAWPLIKSLRIDHTSMAKDVVFLPSASSESSLESSTSSTETLSEIQRRWLRHLHLGILHADSLCGCSHIAMPSLETVTLGKGQVTVDQVLALVRNAPDLERLEVDDIGDLSLLPSDQKTNNAREPLKAHDWSKLHVTMPFAPSDTAVRTLLVGLSNRLHGLRIGSFDDSHTAEQVFGLRGIAMPVLDHLSLRFNGPSGADEAARSRFWQELRTMITRSDMFPALSTCHTINARGDWTDLLEHVELAS